MNHRFAMHVLLLGAISSAACMQRVNLRPPKPNRIAILLRLDPKGACASVTQPQLAHASKGDTLQWEVVNVNCPQPTVQLAFQEKGVAAFGRVENYPIDRRGNQYPSKKEPRAGDQSERFSFLTEAEVVGSPRKQPYKYAVHVVIEKNGALVEIVEDPGVSIDPPY